MQDPLALEWAAYRAACDAVDSLRWHPAFQDPGTPTLRWQQLAERLLDRRRAAVTASERLIRRAEREPDLDPGWLDELRDEHEELLRALPRGERHLAEASGGRRVLSRR